MRAHTKRKHEMGKRFAILIGAAAVGVLAVAVAPGGVAADPHAQAAAARPVVKVSIGDNFFSPVKTRVRRLHQGEVDEQRAG